jgi:hypothetical protein
MGFVGGRYYPSQALVLWLWSEILQLPPVTDIGGRTTLFVGYSIY